MTQFLQHIFIKVQRDRDKFTQLGVFDSPVVPMPMKYEPIFRERKWL